MTFAAARTAAVKTNAPAGALAGRAFAAISSQSSQSSQQQSQRGRSRLVMDEGWIG